MIELTNNLLGQIARKILDKYVESCNFNYIFDDGEIIVEIDGQIEYSDFPAWDRNPETEPDYWHTCEIFDCKVTIDNQLYNLSEKSLLTLKSLLS